MSPHELYISLVAKSKVMNYNYIALGKTLKELKENDKWRDAVGDVDTWQQFVKQPEIGLSVGEANKLIDIYETYVEKMGYDEDRLSQISIKNLKALLQKAKTLDNIESFLYQAETLSDRDFKEALIETRDDLEEVPRTYRYVVMRVCNETKNMNKVHGIESESIKKEFKIIEEGNDFYLK